MIGSIVGSPGIHPVSGLTTLGYATINAVSTCILKYVPFSLGLNLVKIGISAK